MQRIFKQGNIENTSVSSSMYEMPFCVIQGHSQDFTLGEGAQNRGLGLWRGFPLHNRLGDLGEHREHFWHI